MARLVDQRLEPGGAADLADAQRLIDARGAEALLSTRHVAALLGRSVATVRDWRTRRTGPRYIRGGAVTYRWADVQRWLDSRTVDPASTTVDTAVKGGAA